MVRKKTTVYLEEDLLRAAKVRAARTGRKDYEVFEAALKEFLGLAILDRTRARGDLSEDEAAALADDEVHAVRRQRASRERPTRRR